MNILNPTALYLLLVIPPVIILYFMKLRRKRFLVTASFLWEKVMQEARVDSFFQKLKVNILLILQILFILFLVFALIRPYFKSLGSLSAESIFILDISASMKTVEGNKTRFAIAKDRIREFIKEAHSGSAFMLITASDRADIKSGFTTDHTKILRILDRLKPGDTGTNLKPATLLAVSLLKSHPDAKIFLVGDNLPENDDLKLPEIPAFHFISIGKNRDNVGITSFDVSRFSPESPSQLFVRVENFSPAQKNTFLEISYNDILRDAREIQLPAGKAKGFVFEIPKKFSGIVKAELTAKDGLASDNIALAQIERPEEVRVLLISGENAFLEKLLSLLPGVSAHVVTENQVKTPELDNYHVVIWNNCNVPGINKGNHIFINCSFKDGKIRKKGTIKYPRVISWEKAHPIFRFVDLSDTAILKADLIQMPGGAKPLAQSEKGPLMFVVEKKNFRGIHILFNLLESDWQLLPSFPIFMANAIDFLGERSGVSGIENHKTGEVISLEFVRSGEKIEVRAPDNTKLEDLAVVGGIPSFTLETAGLYKVRTGDRTYSIPSNLLDREESHIEPSPPLKVKSGEVKSGRTFALIREIWWELALAALLLLLLEWYIFHKRRV